MSELRKIIILGIILGIMLTGGMIFLIGQDAPTVKEPQTKIEKISNEVPSDLEISYPKEAKKLNFSIDKIDDIVYNNIIK